jgi:uncharacterized protein involved in exopolysaccharide biosynthesis
MTDSQQNPAQSYDDEIDLGEVFRVLWAGKWLIGGITFASAVIAIIVALIMPDIYRAEALLAPNDQEKAGGLSALASQYGGLASLAGISLPAGSTDKTALGLEVLKSRKFIAEFIERHDILVPLMAADDWDAKSGELKIDPDLYDTAVEKWVRNVSPPQKTIPSAQEAYEVFTDALSFRQNKESGLITVSIEHYSPTIAKQWVDWLVDDLNTTIMQQDVREAEQAIEYLNLQIENTSLTELQNVFFRMIEEQTKTVMLAKVSNEYLFKTLDPAIAPELKAKPKRSLIVILATILGGVLGIVIQQIRSSISSDRIKTEN